MTEQPTILVVDDEVGPRESLRAILKPEYQVLVATEGEQALRVIEQKPVDVVLLDLRMPGLSGMRVMEKIKAVDPTIEVILITGYASYDTVLEALRLHAYDYLSKPFDVPHVREAVKRASTHRHTQQMRPQGSKKESGQQSRDLVQELDDLSQTLLRDYADQINGPGKDLLQRVRAISQCMTQPANSLLI